MFFIFFNGSWFIREVKLIFVERISGIKREVGKLGDYLINI